MKCTLSLPQTIIVEGKKENIKKNFCFFNEMAI